MDNLADCLINLILLLVIFLLLLVGGHKQDIGMEILPWGQEH